MSFPISIPLSILLLIIGFIYPFTANLYETYKYGKSKIYEKEAALTIGSNEDYYDHTDNNVFDKTLTYDFRDINGINKINRIIHQLQNDANGKPSMNSYDEALKIYDLINSCKTNINQWIPIRRAAVKVKLLTLEKHKNDLANRKDWDMGEKNAAKNYIRDNKNIDPNTSFLHLLKLLKESKPEDMMLFNYVTKNEINTLISIQNMQLCMNVGDKVLESLYYYWDDYELYDYNLTFGSSNWSFKKLKDIADNLNIGQDLDFTVPDIITEEAQNIQSLISYNFEHAIDVVQMKRRYDIEENLRPFSSLTNKVKKYGYKRYIDKVMPIFEETNRKLAKVDPNNMGFKTEEIGRAHV